MQEEGYRYTCDRCDKQVFITSRMRPIGWSTAVCKDLCKECTEQFNHMLKVFFANGKPMEAEDERE